MGNLRARTLAREGRFVSFTITLKGAGKHRRVKERRSLSLKSLPPLLPKERVDTGGEVKNYPFLVSFVL